MHLGKIAYFTGNVSLGAMLMTTPAEAAVVPFTEDYVASSANWFDSTGGAPLGWSAAGSADGGSYATSAFNFAASAFEDTPVFFRGQDEYGSSGGAFVGNWIGEGVTELTAMVRHNAPVPLTFLTRLSSPINFPGAVAVNFAPVLPNTWTPIQFAIEAASPQFVTFEGTSFNSVFSNIGHVQIGIEVPEALAGLDQSFTFDVDKVSITPEPASLLLLVMGTTTALRRRRVRP